MPEELKGTFEVAVVFNYLIPIWERENFAQQLAEILTPDGEIILTFAEKEVMYESIPTLIHFDVKSARLWKGHHDTPHAYIVVGRKKSTKGLRR